MTIRLDPFVAVLPIYACRDGRKEHHEFKGTGFLIREKGRLWLVTARHVIVSDEEYCVPNMPARDDNGKFDGFWPLTNEEKTLSSKYDIGAIPFDTGSDGFQSLSLSDTDVTVVHDVICPEFSQATPGRHPDFSPVYHVRMFTRKGNVLRRCMAENRTELHPEGAHILELSFPILQGASGAPLIKLEGRILVGVVGIVLGNRDLEMSEPIGSTPIIDQEVTRYKVCIGVGLQLCHIRDFVLSLPPRGKV